MIDHDRLKAYDEEISKEMPKDFKDWWENSKEEWPLIARYVLERRRGEIEWLEIALITKDQKIKELEAEIELLRGELAGENL
jgi:cephalosporin-C deacetylase-like acetyl esterase